MIKIGVIGAGGNTISAHIPKLIEQKSGFVLGMRNHSITVCYARLLTDIMELSWRSPEGVHFCASSVIFVFFPTIIAPITNQPI